MRTITFKASYWSYEEEEYFDDDDRKRRRNVFHVSGLDKNQDTVYVKIFGFTPHAYLEIPMSWSKQNIVKMIKFVKELTKYDNPVVSNTILSMQKLLYRKKTRVLKIFFPTHSSCRRFAYKFAKPLSIPGVGSFQANTFKVHEHEIDPIIKFATQKNILLSGWISVTETVNEEDASLDPEERKFTTATYDMNAHCDDVFAVKDPPDEIVYPTYCSFDIECYSKNHNSKLPTPDIVDNKVFQVAMIFGRMGSKKKEKILLSLYNPHEIEGTKIYRCKNEKNLLLTFRNLVVKRDPDLFIGYNIMKFDWDYMIERSKLLGIQKEFIKMSRIIGKEANIKKSSWNSSAYGEQSFLYLDCQGRTNVDILLEVERNYKLPTYSLNVVSEFFLKDKKDDVSAKQLFMLFQLTRDFLEKAKAAKFSNKEFSQVKTKIRDLFPIRKSQGVVKSLRARLLSCKKEEFEDLVREALTITGRYCVQDTVLPIDLADKLNLWNSMEQMSNVMHVPASYLHSRGQQIKVLAQVYRDVAKQKNLIIPYNDKKDSGIRYQGAIVIEANPGDYKNVGTLDFASLYPTTMIAFNICYTTVLEDNDPTPDSECHILEWEDHVGCEHDPQKRKKEKDKILCAKHRYRFLKVKIDYDEKTGRIIRRNEGLMPRLERNLLWTRKQVKKEMFATEAKIKMNKGLASKQDIEYFQKIGLEIIEPGTLSEKQQTILEIWAGVLNAKQLAIKVSANSCYGAMGASMGFIPFIPGAACVTAMGRKLIVMTIRKIREIWNDCIIVYGDTDSCMICFNETSTKQLFKLCKKASHATTHYLKSWILGESEDYKVTGEYTLDQISSSSKKFLKLTKEEKIKVLEYEAIPIDLEFENMYGRFVLLTKKRYFAHIINEEGQVLSQVKKGIVLARRDNCDFLKITYRKLAEAVLQDKSEKEICDVLYQKITELFTRQVPDTQFIIYMAVKSVQKYAKKRERKVNGNTVVDYLDKNERPIDDVIGPLDPRLVYQNIPQCLLALKMLRRGTSVPGNTRLEYIYIENKNAESQGDKAEDFSYYKENKDIENLRPDLFHYIEKQLMNPITELFGVKFKRKIIPYKKLDDELRESFVMKGLSDLKQTRIARTRRFSKPRPSPTKSFVGWSVYSKIAPSKKFVKEFKSLFRLAPDKLFGEYNSKGIRAKVEFILDSSKKDQPNEFSVNHPIDKKVIDVCKRWRARDILNQLYDAFGMRKRPSKKPSQHGRVFKPGTMVYIYSTGKIGKVVSREEERYTVLLDETTEDIADYNRSEITSFRYQDSTIVKDILEARKAYKKVVDHLNELTSPVVFTE